MNNKNVFITGGDKGIGRAIAFCLAPKYDNVVITYNRNLTGAIEVANLYSNITYIQCDLNNENSIKNVYQQILKKLGHIDILINNAGYENDATFLKMTSEQWDSVIRINLQSIYHFTHAFLPSMVEEGWGKIINFTSIACYTGAFGKSN